MLMISGDNALGYVQADDTFPLVDGCSEAHYNCLSVRRRPVGLCSVEDTVANGDDRTPARSGSSQCISKFILVIFMVVLFAVSCAWFKCYQQPSQDRRTAGWLYV